MCACGQNARKSKQPEMQKKARKNRRNLKVPEIQMLFFLLVDLKPKQQNEKDSVIDFVCRLRKKNQKKPDFQAAIHPASLVNKFIVEVNKLVRGSNGWLG